MRIYGYLRASTDEQDAYRAREALESFIQSKEREVSAWFIENESGAKLNRPELFRLLDIADADDVLLIEQVDRISRLNAEDWESLKHIIIKKGIRIVSLDLPTSFQFLDFKADEFTQRMLGAVNSMLLDMLAAGARKDYEDRRRRQQEGIKEAKAKGKYKGRPENEMLHAQIEGLLRMGKTYSEIMSIVGCARPTIAKVKKRILVDV